MMSKESARGRFKRKYGSRGGSLIKLIEMLKFQSVLYIGASARIKDEKTGERLFKLYFADRLAAHKHCQYVDLLEVWPANIEGLQGHSLFRKLILGNGKAVAEHVDQKYDLIFWWHGPEHIYDHEIPMAVESMKKVCDKHIILGCPWGMYEQGTVYGNPFEEHKSHLHPEFYENLGFITSTIAKPNHKMGNITSWMDVRWEQ